MTPSRLISALVLALATTIPSVSSAGADVPTFDPQTPIDLDRWEGDERPKEEEVFAAFETSYEALDACVAAEKKRTKKDRLDGDAGMAILLNPEGDTPIGVNANVPTKYQKRRALVRCMRSATASAAYPAYDGPPIVVEFEFEIDPGEVWVEEEE